MTLPYTLYPGKAGSPITTLTAQYVAGTDSSVQVEDASVLPSASNRVTIMKTDRSAFVTVKYTTVSGNTLSGLTYEEGDLTTFPEGSIAVRNIANKDFSDVIGDINYLESAKVNVSQGAAESGKYLKVGVDGNVTTGTAVSDYPDLTNKPSINSVTILGNQTGAQLGLVDAVAGKGLSTNDYTNAEKTKLAGIADGAEVNVNADWNAVSGDAQILNKPSIPSKTSDLTNDSTYQTASQVSASISTHNESASAHTDIRTTVSGKQDTISQSNKLSADLVDDTGTTNKFTSDAEKAGWNSKVSDVTLNGTSVVSSNTAVLTTIDNVTTNSQYPLSAKQGKVLNERIDAISSIGRYLSHWNCETGLPTTEPTSLPYTYHTGDYYVISAVSASTNYKPNGAQYTGSASTTTTSEPVAVNDIWRYDGTSWQFELNHSPQGSVVTDVTVGGVTVVSGGIATIPTASASAEGTLSSTDWGTFNAKQDAIDSTHKLSADYIETTNAKQFVASTDKISWNSKATSSDISTAVSNHNSSATAHEDIRTAVSGKADSSALTSHTSNTSNPHSVTKAQVGLPNTVDGAQVNVLESVKDADGNALTITDKAVTLSKTAVGLGNVDNTADTDKTFAESQITNLTADLAGKQAVIDSSNKLSADLVDDTTATNKFYHTHASTHASGGTDAITIAESQVTNLVSDLAGKQATAVTSTATLTAAGWSNMSQTVSVSGVTASNTVIVSPTPASMTAWGYAGIYCSAQGAGTLTFSCVNVPTVAITANVVIL